MLGFSQSRFGRKHFSMEPIVSADCQTLQQIHALSFHHGWSSDDFRSLIGQDTVFGFIARPERNPKAAAGFVLARLVIDEAEILTIAVAPNMQRQGIGHSLMDAVLRHLHHERATSLFLEVDQANEAAQALYRRLGFVKVGDRPAYYQTENESSAALVLRRALVQAK